MEREYVAVKNRFGCFVCFSYETITHDCIRKQLVKIVIYLKTENVHLLVMHILIAVLILSIGYTLASVPQMTI